MAHLPHPLNRRAALWPRSLSRLAAPALVTGALLACTPPGPPAGPAPAPRASASVAPLAPARTGWDDASWGRFHSKRFSLWLSLPDGKAWRINDHKSSWLVATHPPSSSSLSVRVFLEDEAVNRARCEARARDNDPSLPTEPQVRVLDRRDRDVLPGWDALAVASSEVKSKPHQQPLDLEGHLVTYAALVRKCMVIHYATRAVGPDADATLGARLAEAADIVRKIELIDELQGPGKERVAPGP